MSQRTLFLIHAPLAAILLSIHAVAVYYSLYWHYLWLDIPMHFFGGLWAGLMSVWFLRHAAFRVSLVNVSLGIIAIGIAWEIMEFAIGFQREQNHFFDTSLDLVMDFLGGMVGFLAVRGRVTSVVPAHEHTSAS